MQGSAIQNGAEHFTGLPTKHPPRPRHTVITRTRLTFCKLMVTTGIGKLPPLYIQNTVCYLHYIFQRNNYFGSGPRRLIDMWEISTCNNKQYMVHNLRTVQMGEFLDRKK
jgi:hypothetical protein